MTQIRLDIKKLTLGCEKVKLTDEKIFTLILLPSYFFLLAVKLKLYRNLPQLRCPGNTS